MIGNLQVCSSPLSWKHNCRHQSPPPPLQLILITKCALPKQRDRFLSSLATTGDPSAANRLIRKFIASSPKSVALNTLSHLLSPTTTRPHLSSLALPLYLRITEASWFNWNAKLVADVIAVLDKQGRYDESETLICEADLKLKFKERDLVQFYCNLIESCCKHGSMLGFAHAYDRLNKFLLDSSSNYVKQRAYESMVSGLCGMNRACEAENLVEEMGMKGIKPSVFEFRNLVYGYGRLGLFEDMQRNLDKMESEGLVIDTVCSNMVLSSYGIHSEVSKMGVWLQKMKVLGIPFSLRTYNSVLNSCPLIMSMVSDSHSFPISIHELRKILSCDEALLVDELIGSSVLDQAIEWDILEGKLDLHGMHLGSAYLIMLQWMEETSDRFGNGCEIPAEVTVVCGAGKRSSVRGESPVKDLVKEMMIRTKSPMKIDRTNIGCFVAKGKAVKDWLDLLRKENGLSDHETPTNQEM